MRTRRWSFAKEAAVGVSSSPFSTSSFALPLFFLFPSRRSPKPFRDVDGEDERRRALQCDEVDDGFFDKDEDEEDEE